ncbi:unnamed protein product [Effrenium voratum]|nr:unnamed protein product [Effrenium voratum]
MPAEWLAFNDRFDDALDVRRLPPAAEDQPDQASLLNCTAKSLVSEGPAAPVDRRHSDILPLRDPAYGNVAQKVAVYEAFRQICTLSKTSFDEGAGAAGGDLPCRAGTGGTAGPASPARYRCSGSGESRVPERRDLSPASPLLSSCPSPEPRSKQWILQRLVDAGALPLQEEDKFLQSLGRGRPR